MSKVEIIAVRHSDNGIRLDRWLKKYFPSIPYRLLQKLVRTGQIRIDGKRVKADQRINTGEYIRIPPYQTRNSDISKSSNLPIIDDYRHNDLRKSVIYRDDDVLILNKPSGLAVQGGTKVHEHLDGYLDALRFNSQERPRLVHRLDKGTSGVLVLARNANASRWLSSAFKERNTQKLYWAIVVGVPRKSVGSITNALKKGHSDAKEKMMPTLMPDGQKAKTLYRVIRAAVPSVAWLALEPYTGRTHQLRVHVADVLRTPILGDRKYGGLNAIINTDTISNNLHLHSREIKITAPNGRCIKASADLPKHMISTFKYFGFKEEYGNI